MSTRATTTEQTVTPLGLRPQSHHRAGWSGNRSLVAGLIVIGIIVLAAVFAPLLTSHDPTHQDLLHPLQGFSSRHPLGTDDLGRDVWAQLLYGARVDLQVAFLAVLFPFLIGTTLGCLAGYYGRWVDVVVMRAVEIVVAFPFYVLILALVFVLGQGTRSIYIAITMVGWVSYARIVRGEVLTAKRREYVLAAQVAGLRDGRIIARHLLPNVITQALVFAMSDIVLDILVIVALGYLGLGVPPPTPDWGRMIADGQNFITTHWQIATIPGLAVVLVGLGLSLVGDGLADFLRIE
jgi:peptide/nickel transport system permease protein